MYFVCCKKGNKYGIIDTRDYVVEYYTIEQICSLVKKNIYINGVVMNNAGMRICVLEPSTFNTLSDDYLSSSIYSKKDAEVKRTKNKFLNGVDFYELFSSLSSKYCKHTGNKTKMILKLRSVEAGSDNTAKLYFGFDYDYSTSSDTIDHSALVKVLSTSCYRDKLVFYNCKQIYKFSDTIFSMEIPTYIFRHIVSNLRDIYYKDNISTLMSKRSNYEYQDLYLTKERQKTNIGVTDVINIFFNYNGIMLPIIIGARKDYIQNSNASDSEIFYKYLDNIN